MPPVQVPIPPRLYTLLVCGLLCIVGVALVGDYALQILGKTPDPTPGNLAHVALGGLIGLLVVPGGSGAAEKKPDAA